MNITNDKEKTIMGFLQDITRQEWNAPAFSDYGTETHYNHREVFEEIAKIHILLNEYGVKRGDKIAICDKNSCNWVICFLGAFTYGAVVVPMLADFSTEQIDAIVSHSDSVLLFTNRNVFRNSLKTDKAIMIDVKTFKPFELESPTKLNEIYSRLNSLFDTKYPVGVKPEDVVFEDVDPNDLALLSYTSGSTGNPKGVMIPYRAIWSNIVFAREMFPVQPENKFLSLLPLAHMFGFAFDFFFPYTLGCHISFLTKVPSPAIVLKAFKEVKPFLIISVPLVIEKIIQGKVMPALRKPKMQLMMKIPGMKKVIYSKVRKQLFDAFGGNFAQVVLGGAGVSKDVDQLLHKLKFPYTIGYGMTEAAPLICYSFWKDFIPSSCGKPVHRMEVKILSDDPQNTPGEIVCRGMNVMLGYYKNKTATNETIDEDGWLHTGDLGTIDNNGNLYIRGRKKNMLLGANGQNIYPEEIEDKITSTTIIDETVVVQRGQKLVALVYATDQTLADKGMSRNEFNAKLNDYRRTINASLPKFCQLSALEVQSEEFSKTPKRNIKRYLYK